jgi:ABC-type sugar transport system permease subunit
VKIGTRTSNGRAEIGPTGRRPLGREEMSQARLGWLFVAPICLLIVVLVAYPLLLAFQMSTQDVGLGVGSKTRGVGLDNFVELLTAD